MPWFAVVLAITGIISSGVSVVGAVLGATVLGVEVYVLLWAFAFAFLAAAVAYYSMTIA